MEKFIKDIIKKNTHCIFVSPHLDDAVLSAGELLSQLSGKVPVTVVTVFTEGTNDRPTLSAKQFLKYSGYQDARTLFAQRRKEDKAALSLIHLDSQNLGFVEALWRRRTDKFSQWLGKFLPEFAYVYPIYRFLITSGRVSNADSRLRLSLQDKILSLVDKETNFLVFCPLGVGGHVDHWVVREACERAVGNQVVYWSDFPYTVRVGTVGECPSGYMQINLPVRMEDKEKLIRAYTSQVSGLFPGELIPEHKEVYFVKHI